MKLQIIDAAQRAKRFGSNIKQLLLVIMLDRNKILIGNCQRKEMLCSRGCSAETAQLLRMTLDKIANY